MEIGKLMRTHCSSAFLLVMSLSGRVYASETKLECIDPSNGFHLFIGFNEKQKNVSVGSRRDLPALINEDSIQYMETMQGVRYISIISRKSGLLKVYDYDKKRDMGTYNCEDFSHKKYKF